MSERNEITEALTGLWVALMRFGLEQIGIADGLAGGPISPGLLTREQAAAYLGVGTSKFDELRRGKGFPKEVRIGAKPLWRRSDLDRYIMRLKIAG